jgi:hypothetical protein
LVADLLFVSALLVNYELKFKQQHHCIGIANIRVAGYSAKLTLENVCIAIKRAALKRVPHE